MLKKIVFILLLAFSLRGQGLIIDHTAVQTFDQIPSEYLALAKQLTFHYACTSHGMQVMSGMKHLYEQIDPDYKFAAIFYYSQSPNPATALPNVAGAFRVCNLGRKPDGYWNTEAGKNEVRSFLSTGLYKISAFGWCGELSGSVDLSAYIDTYLNALNTFSLEFPNVKIIYFTAPTDGSPSYSKLKIHNQRIRDYCISHNKILFDFADIESWDLAGNYYPNNYACSWCADWCIQHPEDCVNLLPQGESGTPTCCPHTHGLNCLLKAKAFWVLLAKLSGWNDTGVDITPPDQVQNLHFEGGND